MKLGFPGRLADGKRAYRCFSKATFMNTMCFDGETMIQTKVSCEPRDSTFRAKATVI